ncbi:hypothetical protein AVEN_95753-1 [Araneus ventricosus]|uniref:Uncharacterized protein n=1 Tax=Araneus ventricosus TaxID=182803 RepID=A0A4Y2W456_ARAVE|nr:hypothetical protein AVEN_95753-1 [Araneus ventricosus]
MKLSAGPVYRGSGGCFITSIGGKDILAKSFTTSPQCMLTAGVWKDFKKEATHCNLCKNEAREDKSEEITTTRKLGHVSAIAAMSDFEWLSPEEISLQQICTKPPDDATTGVTSWKWTWNILRTTICITTIRWP